MSHDAIIIGGGPAGSTAAICLARLGWSVAIVEKAVFPRRKVCGEFLSASNLALIDRLGVGDAWRRRAGPEVRRVGFFCGKATAEAPMPRVDAGCGRALGRDVLDSMLLEAARDAGAEIFQPWRAIIIAPHSGGTEVTIEARKRLGKILAPVVIAAHGSWAPGPLPTEPQHGNLASDLIGFKAHFTGHALPSDLMPLLVFPGGYGGMVCTDGGRVSISLCIRRRTLGELRDNGTSAGTAIQRHLVESCAGVRAALRDAKLEGSWLAAGPIRPGIRSGYANDIFRIGNVAGEAHPIIAEGISMALQSGWLLATELAAESRNRAGRERAGAAYVSAWRRQFRTRIQVASSLARLALLPGGAAAMRLGLRAMPSVLTLGATLSGKAQREAFAARWIHSLERKPLNRSHEPLQ